MREILFRGKCIDNGEWYEGFLICIGEKCFILGKPIEINNVHSHITAYGVIPETVGQFTGLTDKNGKRFFEGDIVKRTDLHISNEPSIGFIEYDKDNSAFLIHWTDIEEYSATFPWKEVIEVIGNIHDTPELLNEK